MYDIKSISLTDTGIVRSVNEDAVLDGEGFFAVADGMGGHNAGEVASSMAVSLLDEYVAQNRCRLSGPELLRNAIGYANKRIYEKASSSLEFQDMGTTLTALYLSDSSVFIGSVGDSRAYLYRGGALKRLTHDDSLVAKLVEDGVINEEEAIIHPRRNVILKALGVGPTIDIEIVDEETEQGDLFMLSTDGLTSLVEDKEMESVLAGGQELSKKAKRLLDLALERGGTDNISVILVLLEEKDSGGAVGQAGENGRNGRIRVRGLFRPKRKLKLIDPGQGLKGHTFAVREG
ncbi:MAG: Stp1/IreP family PP2C-type Ser/Thr phosphatase [Actinobacteria bacterium]|nr:Stp1/IreP family PP2C-type Ser/Thr phosphatase [Actinomycetota bacterium]